MFQSTDNTREGFLCPQCHQDMSNMEMLQIHFQNVHMKQSATVGKGLFSTAKQKLKSVQDSFKTSNDPSKTYAPYFLYNQNDSYSNQQYIGHMRSYDNYFRNLRKDKQDQTFIITNRLLLRIELLTNTNEHIPRNGNTKERRKYEQDIVPWMEDSIASICSSCSKSFGISKRKHHCRLDGLIICVQCSQFLSFSNARYIIDPNTSTTQQMANLISITTPTMPSNTSNEDYLRICVTCRKFLQKFYDKIRFKNIEKDEIFHLYEKIVQTQKEYNQFHPTYATIIDSLLNGNTKYQISDAQHAYRQLTVSYEKIDSLAKSIVKLADSCEYDAVSKNRYVTLCRNIRTYSLQVLQTYTISTRRVPSEDDIKRARSERMTKLALAIPGMNCNSLEITKELEPFIQQYHQIMQFIQQAKLAGRDDEVRLLEQNLKELELAMSAFK